MQISRTVARPSLVVARTTWFGSHSATMREIAQYPTALPADCVARCPDEPGLVVCGTYDYDKATKVRSGTLTLHCVSESGATSSTPIQVPSGVFDLCWQRRASGKNVAITPPAGHKTGNTGSMLACAAADGKVHLYSLLSVPTDADAAGCPFSLVLESNFGLDTANDESADLYCLAADWCGNALLTSYTNGSLGLFDSPTESLVRSWDAAHVFYGAPSEVWACAIDPHSSSVLYSGADDGLFKSWDARVDGEKPTGQSRKMDGGVCCIRAIPEREHLILTGSYDNKVRLWDARNLRAVLSESDDLGGGVWRMSLLPPNFTTVAMSKLDSSQQDTTTPVPVQQDIRLACACMRGGFRVLRVDVESNTLASEVGSCFSEAGSEGEDWEALAYGVDWATPDVLAACSFYDKKFRVLHASPPTVSVAETHVGSVVDAGTVDVDGVVQGSNAGAVDSGDEPPASSLEQLSLGSC